jgi:hypothetical protein
MLGASGSGPSDKGRSVNPLDGRTSRAPSNASHRLLTLFEILTLEGWVDLMNTSLAATGWAWIYYVSFVVLAVFVIVNLFIAIVINNLEAAKREEPVASDWQTGALAARLAGIREQLEAIESALRAAHDVPGARRPE